MKEIVLNAWEDQVSCRFSFGLLYVFLAGEAAVKIDSKQFDAADSLYNLILESDLLGTLL